MAKPRRNRISVTSVLCLSLLCASSVSAVRIPIPQGVFYYQPAAAVFGSETMWINPAGLARYRADNYQVMVDYFDGEFADSWGLVSSANGMGIAWRQLADTSSVDFSEYIFAFGSKFRNFGHIGGSYRYYKDAPGIYNNRHFWNVGLLSNTGRPFNWAAVFSNLNRGRVGSERSEIEQRYSLSYRPSGLSATLSVDMFLSSDMRLSNADFIYHLEARPRPGLFVNGYLDSDRNFQVGFRVNLTRFFIGGQSRFDSNGNGRGTTLFAGKTSIRQPSIVKEKKRRLAISISGAISENPPRPIFGRKRTAFTELVLSIYRAAEDPSVGEMLMSLRSLRIGMGQAQELRQSLLHFRAQGKRVVSHLFRPNNIEYFVASASDQILIPPVSQLNLVGLRAELTFYGGSLEKLGIKVDMMRIGDYKTAAEMFTERSASDENREQINRLLDDLYDQFTEAIAAGRSISADSVRTIIDNGPFTSQEALQYGLVDGLSYRDNLHDDLLKPMPEVSFRRYLTDTLANDSWITLPTIAVVVAEGEIRADGRGAAQFCGSSKLTPSPMKRAFRRAMLGRDVDAVLFRVNSPGGLALAADEIYHAADKSMAKKLLVVSMSNVAASGGYQIAMPASRLFANEASITGSIGIFGGKLDLSELYRKIDLGKELFTRGKYAGMLTSMRPFSEDERAKYYSQMSAFYHYFVGLVADNRGLAPDSVNSLGRGRVWTGREALANGLVDENGGIKAALDHLADRLHVSDYRVRIFPRNRPLFTLPGKPFFSKIASLLGLGGESEISGGSMALLESDGDIFTRLPFDIHIE